MKGLWLYVGVFCMLLSTVGWGQWLCPWEFRQEIDIRERSGDLLTDYQIKIDVPFVTGMNANYSDIRFTQSDGISLLSYYIEAYDASRAVTWVKIPSLPADTEISIYLYYCNTSASTLSNPQSTFLFYDDFDSFNNWVQYGAGTVSQDLSTFPGISTLKKTNGCDPSGGYKLLGQDLTSFRMIVREHRKNEGQSCGLNRYGLEDSGFDGYSLNRSATTNGNSNFGYERRNNGGGSNSKSTNLAQPNSNWYRTELTRCFKNGGRLEAILYDDAKNEIGSVSGNDNTYGTFDRVIVHGGNPYYFDFIAVGHFVCDAPRVRFRSTDVDQPIANCQDITVNHDADGNYTLDPQELDAGSTDCNPLTYVSDQTTFSCADLGNNNVELTVIDPKEEKDKCNANVFVQDTLAPVVQCPADLTIVANQANCSAIATWTAPTASDNCSIDDVQTSHDPGDLFALGTTIVNYQYTDPSDNIETCSFTITVISNASAPQISVAENSGNSADDGVICDGDEACLTPTAGFDNYLWSTGATSEEFCVNTDGSYTLTVTNTIGCTANSSAITISAVSNPTGGTCLLNNDYCQLEEGSVRVQAASGAPPYTVNWLPAIGSSSSATIQNSGEFINIENIPGGTTINISIVDNNGCEIN